MTDTEKLDAYGENAGYIIDLEEQISKLREVIDEVIVYLPDKPNVALRVLLEAKEDAR